MTNQRRIFKLCLTQTERVSDDVTPKIGPLDFRILGLVWLKLMKHEVEKLIVQILSKLVVLCNIKTTFLYSDFNKVVVVAIDLMMMTTMMTMRAGGKEMDCYFHAVEPCHVQRCLVRAPQLERIVVTTPTLSS